jgi:hypothetical protein
VSRFSSSDGGMTLDKGSEEVLIAELQPFSNHNGGQIAFGPDNMLYIGWGDGGSAGDPFGNAQNTETLLGKMLRLDVSDGGASAPADNPFVGQDGRDEIYALGLRNPWRFSFDQVTGELWLADVGQNETEEIDIIEKGGNYGWNVREGDDCFNAAVCEDDFIGPVATYDHSDGVSITGGFVYRGNAMPNLEGAYIHGDFATGRIWALHRNPIDGSAERELLVDSNMNPSSFAQGRDGEVFMLDYASGGIFRIVPGSVEEVCPPDPALGFDAPQLESAELTFETLYNTVIEPNCSPCHTLRGMGGLHMRDADQAFEELINRDAETDDCLGRTRVVPGDASQSLMFQKVSGINLCGPRMPTTLNLFDDDIEAIRAWIEAGAKR